MPLATKDWARRSQTRRVRPAVASEIVIDVVPVSALIPARQRSRKRLGDGSSKPFRDGQQTPLTPTTRRRKSAHHQMGGGRPIRHHPARRTEVNTRSASPKRASRRNRSEPQLNNVSRPALCGLTILRRTPSRAQNQPHKARGQHKDCSNARPAVAIHNDSRMLAVLAKRQLRQPAVSRRRRAPLPNVVSRTLSVCAKRQLRQGAVNRR